MLCRGVGGFSWEQGRNHATPCGIPIPHAVPQALGGSDLMLLSIIIFTNSTAIEPGSSAIIIMLSLLLIILIVSINYKQEWGAAGRSREAGAPLGGGGGETGSPPTHLLLHPFRFWPKPEPGPGILEAPGGLFLPGSQGVPGHLTQSPTLPHRNY